MAQNSIQATFPCTQHELLSAGNALDLTGRNVRCLLVIGGGSVEMTDQAGTTLTYDLPAGIVPFIPSAIGASTAVDIVIWS